ncbi:hypothetical protein [Streptomyces sp. NPDC005423]|uniref:MmyB family transcriptional regulator n=1 Tax=Streptomyces sp. NPDC005423 TaxID=3155343 RepID=UPI0033A56E0C
MAPATRQFVSALTEVPVLVLGRRRDVPAWNRTGHPLFAGHLAPESPDRPAERPNLTESAFLDGRTRDLHADRRQKARGAPRPLPTGFKDPNTVTGNRN